MKMNIHKYIIFFLAIAFMIGVVIYKTSLNMNTVMKKPKFKGRVEEIQQDYVKILSLEDSKTYGITKDMPYMVSRNVKLGDSHGDLRIGNIVTIYFDGNITDDVPPKIDTTYAFSLMQP